MVYYKKVLKPIRVSAGDFCWGDGRCCDHYDGKDVFCGEGFCPLEIDEEGRVPKPKECLDLQEVGIDELNIKEER